MVLLMWGVLFCILLLLGNFIRISTWGNFNCSFGIYNSDVSFDGIKLLIVFVVFELEIVVVVMVISGIAVVILLMVTILELMMLYM